MAPTPEPVGPPRGDNAAEYNIVNSFETGYRWNSIGGNPDEYRSQVNYDSGVRLLGSSFSMNSRDGHGKFFDEIVLTTQGLGNDPYESATLRVAKEPPVSVRHELAAERLRQSGPGERRARRAAISATRAITSQDDDLTLFPQSKIKFFLGYSRSVQDGPEFTSVGGFFASQRRSQQDTAGFTSVRDARNEYRVGNEFQILGITGELDARLGGFQGGFPGSRSPIHGAPCRRSSPIPTTAPAPIGAWRCSPTRSGSA